MKQSTAGGSARGSFFGGAPAHKKHARAKDAVPLIQPESDGSKPAGSLVDALAADPLELFRQARLAAEFPAYPFDPALLDAARDPAFDAPLAALPDEKVGRELLRALAAPRPSLFLLFLAEAGRLAPRLAEFAGMENVPAGPPQFHRGTVLEHCCLIMDALAGDPLAVWMGLAHDLGKLSTPVEILPHHYGHEKRGKAAARRAARRLMLPTRFEKAGATAAELHMQGGIYPQLRIGTKRDLLMRVHCAGLDIPFWNLASADSGLDMRTPAERDLAVLLAVKLPEALRGQGTISAERFRLLQCEALKRAYQKS